MTPMASEERLERVVRQCLEEAAFIFADEVLPTGAWDAACRRESISATLSFSGKETGYCTLSASAAFCRLLAANLLGVDEDEDQALRMGASSLAELLNIVLGLLVADAYGPTHECSLGVPECPSLERETVAPASMIVLDAEGHPVRLCVHLGAETP